MLARVVAAAVVPRSAAESPGTFGLCSGDFAPPSPPAEQTTAREDQAWQASTGDGAGNVAHTRDSVVETESFEAAHRFTKSD